jgi:hypothetical protein
LHLTRLIGDYTRSWTLLQAYDEQTLEEPESNPDSPQILSEKEAISAIQNLKNEKWNYCNVLRDDGVTYHQYISELTYLLFQKMAEETDWKKS